MNPDQPKLALNAGRPNKYDKAISLMRFMGWSYDDLLSAPNDLVSFLVEDLNFKGKWLEKKRRIELSKEK